MLYAKSKGKGRVKLNAKAIGARVLALRKQRNWRQVDLADASGVHAGVIGRIELGLRTPSLRAAIGLSISLRRKLEWLLLGGGGGS